MHRPVPVLLVTAILIAARDVLRAADTPLACASGKP